jgi:hypothetical protein
MRSSAPDAVMKHKRITSVWQSTMRSCDQHSPGTSLALTTQQLWYVSSEPVFEHSARQTTQLQFLILLLHCCYCMILSYTVHAESSEGCNVATCSLHDAGRLGCRFAELTAIRNIITMVEIVALRRWLYFVAALRLLSGERSIITKQHPASASETHG